MSNTAELTRPEPAPEVLTSPQGKLRVFISYSRDDLDFADQLYAALELCGFDATIDRHDISGGEEWRQRLTTMISEADTIVFVLSPVSAGSEVCSWEVDVALRFQKRLIPVICKPLGAMRAPKQLEEINYVFFYAEPKAPGSGFGVGLSQLVDALKTDFEWLRTHTHYLQHAMEWQSGGKQASRLLSGGDISQAKAWAARRPPAAPELTDLHREYIRASEEEAAARANAQRRQLELMAAAQAERETALRKAEAALQDAAQARRRRTRALAGGFIVSAALAVTATAFYVRSEKSRTVAEEILEKASNVLVKISKQLDAGALKDVIEVYKSGATQGHPRSMNNLAVAYQHGDGVDKSLSEAVTWFQAAVSKGDARAMSNLGLLYAKGEGVPADPKKARQLFQNSADKGDEYGLAGLGQLYLSDKGGAPRDLAKAVMYLELAAQRGAHTAMIVLAHMYATGVDVPKDLTKARSYLEMVREKASKDFTHPYLEAVKRELEAAPSGGPGASSQVPGDAPAEGSTSYKSPARGPVMP